MARWVWLAQHRAGVARLVLRKQHRLMHAGLQRWRIALKRKRIAVSRRDRQLRIPLC
jgi:hypothetical protein